MRATILNLTQHPATPEQTAAGVVDLPPDERRELIAALTVDELPTADEMDERCSRIGILVRGWRADHPECRSVMIGGAPWFMAPLEYELSLDFSDEDHDDGEVTLSVLYAFSRRESIETTDPVTGEVRKTAVFRHAGFVTAWKPYAERHPTA